ncbi:MAG TPA: SPOR domain-containing protein [Edaphobacter sp.]|nr:SPOR domain-containing protein [Edaphobacter sp.]
MQLWNDYEGRTIAEAYPLKKLIRPEGRSAFFLTTNGTGTPSMVRLIEAHFDESEILTRWKTISEIHQENLVAMRKFGETTLDGTPLVYAVMEPTEMSLADVLQSRTLTVDETKQLAASLIAALTALHQRGLVHEHLDPSNVLAAGETVKLRSDCVREAASPDGDEAEANRRKAADVQELAALLLQAMTGRRSLQGSATMLTPPFDGIIRNGLSGKWGLIEMATALGPVAKPQEASAPAPSPSATKIETKPQPAVSTTEKMQEPKAASAGPLFERSETSKAAATPEPAASRTTSASGVAAARPLTQTQAPDVRHRIVRPVEQEPKRLKMIAAIAIAALVLLAVGWYFLRSGTKPVPEAAVGTAPVRSAPPASAATSVPAPTPAATADTPAPARTGHPEWRVVAYTYNHQDQAQKKADELRAKHPAMNPEVFSPHGRAPYLVTVGGAMTRDQAIAYRAKARSAGLPRDTYARNYTR